MTNRDELIDRIKTAIPGIKISKDYYSEKFTVETYAVPYSRFINIKFIVDIIRNEDFLIKVESEDSIVKRTACEKKLIKILKALVS